MNVKLGDDGVTATSRPAYFCPPTWGPASSNPSTISSLMAASSSLTWDLPVSDAEEEGEIWEVVKWKKMEMFATRCLRGGGVSEKFKENAGLSGNCAWVQEYSDIL